MQVSFYSVTGRTNDINKLDTLSGFSLDVELYNDFNPAAPTFYLDRLREANYCRFTYNGKTWVCSISLVSFTDRIAVYSGSVDALATAWYNGCMDSLQLVQYSADGNGSVMSDSRALRRSIIDRRKFTMQELSWTRKYAVLTVMYPNTATHNVNDGNRGNPNIRTYILKDYTDVDGQYTAFGRFLNNYYNFWTDAEQQRYGQSILNITFVPEELVLTNPITTMTTFPLYAIQSGIVSGETHKNVDLVDRSCYRSYSYSPTYDMVRNMQLTIDASLVDAPCTLYIAGVGALKFRFGDLGISGTITSIGARIQIDYTGPTISATLLINGNIYDHIFVQTPYTLTTATFIDTSITNWMQISSGVILTIAGIAVAASTAGAGTPIAVGAIGAAISGAGSVATSVYGAETGSIGIHGALGGLPDIAASRSSALIIEEAEAVDLAGFQALYGKPDGRRVNISQLSGYVQTLGARLPLNGLPYDIVQAAEGGLNAGAYIL